MCECCGGHHHGHYEVLKVEGMSCDHCKNAVLKETNHEIFKDSYDYPQKFRS